MSDVIDRREVISYESCTGNENARSAEASQTSSSSPGLGPHFGLSRLAIVEGSWSSRRLSAPRRGMN